MYFGEKQYAVGYVRDLPIYGAKATLSVWNPVVESEDDFSLAQIWVTSGSYENNDLNTLETGWQVMLSNYTYFMLLRIHQKFMYANV